MNRAKRVLIVEDDVHIANLLRMHLRDEGYEVTHAATGDDGLRLLESDAWSALVLDLTDLSDTVVVRRVLMPENYLTPEQLRGPFGPAGELKISVPIEVTGVQVNGYQLDKFFP